MQPVNLCPTYTSFYYQRIWLSVRFMFLQFRVIIFIHYALKPAVRAYRPTASHTSCTADSAVGCTRCLSNVNKAVDSFYLERAPDTHMSLTTLSMENME